MLYSGTRLVGNLIALFVMSKRILFNLNSEKAIECVLWLIQRSSGKINFYNLLKSIFSADCYHLNKYGIPIYGDRYKAMRHGTVPSYVYDVLKKDPAELAYLQTKLPFSVDTNSWNVSSSQNPDTGKLSESNIEALEFGFKEYENLSFGEVREKNHRNEAWRKAYEEQENSIIPVEDLIDDKELIEDLLENSREMLL